MNSYADALDKYTERRNAGNLERGVKLGNNTYLEWEPDETRGVEPEWFAVRLHSTNVVTFHADGRVVLDSGGWLTVTTKARLNDYIPSGWRVYADRGVWCLAHYASEGGWDNAKAYADGITIYPSMGIESVTGEGEDPKAQQKLRKRIKAYAKGYIEAFYAGEVPAPSGGDCFGCSMVSADGIAPMGGSDHMLTHIEESYFVPSILARATKRFGCSRAAQHSIAVVWDTSAPQRLGGGLHDTAISGFIAKQLEKAVRRHCYAECGLGV